SVGYYRRDGRRSSGFENVLRDHGKSPKSRLRGVCISRRWRLLDQTYRLAGLRDEDLGKSSFPCKWSDAGSFWASCSRDKTGYWSIANAAVAASEEYARCVGGIFSGRESDCLRHRQ